MNDAVNDPLPAGGADWANDWDGGRANDRANDRASDRAGKRRAAPGGGARPAAPRVPDAMVDFVRSRLMAMVEDARDSMVGQVRGLKSFADLIGGNVGGSIVPVARLAGEAAGAIDAIADALAEKSVEELVADGRDLVRARPAAAIGLAIAIGFLAGRLLQAARD